MGIDTLGVILGHVKISEIESAVRDALPGARVGARQLTGPDVWIVDAISGTEDATTVTAYLNSYAASDYGELGLQDTTMVLVEHGPQSEVLVRNIIGKRSGWIKSHDGAVWQATEPC
jgi:hypothetical protein